MDWRNDCCATVTMTMTMRLETNQMVRDALKHTRRHTYRVMWRDAVKLADVNQTVIRDRQIQQRKKNAILKAQVKQEILMRPNLLKYLRIPVNVSTLYAHPLSPTPHPDPPLHAPNHPLSTPTSDLLRPSMLASHPHK